jgi:hypothetical protein
MEKSGESHPINCTGHVSGITFNRYAQSQKIGKPNNLIKNVLGARKPKCLNGQGLR